MSSEKNTSSKNKAGNGYKNKILFGRLSKAGNHIYAYQHEDILAPGVKSLLINVAELQAVIDGKADYVKISAMEDGDRTEEQSVLPNTIEEDSAIALGKNVYSRAVTGMVAALATNEETPKEKVVMKQASKEMATKAEEM